MVRTMITRYWLEIVVNIGVDSIVVEVMSWMEKRGQKNVYVRVMDMRVKL